MKNHNGGKRRESNIILSSPLSFFSFPFVSLVEVPPTQPPPPTPPVVDLSDLFDARVFEWQAYVSFYSDLSSITDATSMLPPPYSTILFPPLFLLVIFLILYSCSNPLERQRNTRRETGKSVDLRFSCSSLPFFFFFFLFSSCFLRLLLFISLLLLFSSFSYLLYLVSCMVQSRRVHAALLRRQITLR